LISLVKIKKEEITYMREIQITFWVYPDEKERFQKAADLHSHAQAGKGNLSQFIRASIHKEADGLLGDAHEKAE
jgi:hypothetical protein